MIEPITDPLFLALAIPAVLMVGIAKGGVPGLGLLGVPLLALVISPVQAAGIFLPILIVMDAFGAWGYRKEWDKRIALGFVPAATIGVIIGFVLADNVDENMVRLVLGLIALFFSFNFVRQQLKHGQLIQRSEKGPRRWWWGSLTGFTSFVAHAGGPPYQAYALPLGHDKTKYVATSVLFFGLINLIKLPPYAMLGQFDATNIATSLMLAPLAPIGIWTGMWLHKRIREAPFFYLAYFALAAAGVKLVWDGIQSLH